MKYYCVFTVNRPEGFSKTILPSVKEVFELQNSLVDCLKSIVEIHALGGKAQYVWTAEGFRRTLNHTQNSTEYREFFEESRKGEGSFLINK